MVTALLRDWKINEKTNIPYYEKPLKNNIFLKLCMKPDMDYDQIRKVLVGQNITKVDFENVRFDIQNDKELQDVVKRINPHFSYNPSSVVVREPEKKETPNWGLEYKPEGGVKLTVKPAVAPMIPLGNQVAMRKTARELQAEAVAKLEQWILENPVKGYPIFNQGENLNLVSYSTFNSTRNKMIEDGKIPNEPCERVYRADLQMQEPTNGTHVHQQGPGQMIQPVKKTLWDDWHVIDIRDQPKNTHTAIKTVLERFIKLNYPNDQFRYFYEGESIEIMKGREATL